MGVVRREGWEEYVPMETTTRQQWKWALTSSCPLLFFGMSRTFSEMSFNGTTSQGVSEIEGRIEEETKMMKKAPVQIHWTVRYVFVDERG
jgi:hypothetical protein